MASSQVWPADATEPPTFSYSALGTLMDPPQDHDGAETDLEGELNGGESSGTPLLPTKKGKAGKNKRIFMRASSGQITMRCGSIHDSLETSRKGLVRQAPPPPLPCAPARVPGEAWAER